MAGSDAPGDNVMALNHWWRLQDLCNRLDRLKQVCVELDDIALSDPDRVQLERELERVEQDCARAIDWAQVERLARALKKSAAGRAVA